MVLIGTTAISNAANAPTFIPFTGDPLQTYESNTIGGNSYRIVSTNKDGIVRLSADLGDITRISVKYGLDYEKVLSTLYCESNLRHYGVFGDQGRAYGIAQFHYPTFKRYCSGNYYDMYDQLECFGKMISKGLQNHWTCY